MRTTLDLPDALMREVKIRAAQQDRKLKDLVEELIRVGLGQPVRADSSAVSKRASGKRRSSGVSGKTSTAGTNTPEERKGGATVASAPKTRISRAGAKPSGSVETESDAFVDSQFPL